VETIPLKRFDLHGHQRTRIGLGATVATPLGSVHVIDVHLDSRINPGERLEQLAPVLESAARSAERCVIAGDFNTTDFRFLGRWLPIPAASRQRQAVTQTMAAVGFETPFLSTGATFKHLGLKLDWIFARRLRPEAWGIVPIRFSDHHAIWTRMS
jgi:endonuclease/exonuclease/phosphatase family metal-dependent hydrolase